MAREKFNVLFNCVLGTMFKRSGAGILAGNSFRDSGKRLGAYNGKRALLSGTSRKALRRKERGGLLSKGELLGKGDEPETQRGVPVKGKGEAWMPHKQLKGKV